MKSCNKYLSQVSSQTVLAIERYSASAEERETTLCFLERHKIGLVPKKVTKQVTERLVVGHAAQSESQ
jgi:hypothetical protein